MKGRLFIERLALLILAQAYAAIFLEWNLTDGQHLAWAILIMAQTAILFGVCLHRQIVPWLSPNE